MLAEALYRLIPLAAEALTSELGVVHWAALAAWLVFMGYAEGWRGFHQRFAPRAVARAYHLGATYRAIDVLLAPFYCLSLYTARHSRRMARP